MNRRRIMFVLGLAVLAAVAVLVARQIDSGRTPPGPLAGSGLGGPFALVDQDGRAVTDRTYAGKYLLVYFGYTYCPDVCPLDTQKIATALKAFEASDPGRAAKVQPLFITVDPARDTPAVLKKFVAAFHPRLIGLSGTEAQTEAVKRAYRVYAQRAGPPGAADYLVDHSAVLYLMGPDGQPISFAAHDATAADITAQLDRYVR